MTHLVLHLNFGCRCWQVHFTLSDEICIAEMSSTVVRVSALSDSTVHPLERLFLDFVTSITHEGLHFEIRAWLLESNSGSRPFLHQIGSEQAQGWSGGGTGKQQPQTTELQQGRGQPGAQNHGEVTASSNSTVRTLYLGQAAMVSTQGDSQQQQAKWRSRFLVDSIEG